MKQDSSVIIEGENVGMDIQSGQLTLLKNGADSTATTVVAKSDDAYIYRTLPSLTSTTWQIIFNEVTLTNIKVSTFSENKIYLQDVTLAGANRFYFFGEVEADRLTLSLGTYSDSMSYTLFGNFYGSATTTVTESLVLDVDFGELASIHDVNISLLGLVLGDGLDSSAISFAGYDITSGGFVADGSGNYTFSGTLASQSIPEPSTASLSLLALAGLLARRRRKA